MIVLSMLSISVSGAARYRLQFPLSSSFRIRRCLPGDYVVSANVLSNGTLILTGAEGKRAVSTTPVEATNNRQEPALVFHIYGDKHFLAQVRLGGGTDRQVQRSKAETTMIARNATRSELLVQAR